MSPSGSTHGLCSEQLLFLKRSTCHTCLLKGKGKKRFSELYKENQYMPILDYMGPVLEESYPIATVTLKPLGTIQECTYLKRGTSDAPVT